MTRIEDNMTLCVTALKKISITNTKKYKESIHFFVSVIFFELVNACRGFLKILFFSKILKKDVVENKKKHTLAMLKVSSILKIQVGVPKDWSKPKSLNIPAAKVL